MDPAGEADVPEAPCRASPVGPVPHHPGLPVRARSHQLVRAQDSKRGLNWQTLRYRARALSCRSVPQAVDRGEAPRR